MEIIRNEESIDTARLFTLTDLAKKTKRAYSSLYMMKIRGQLDFVTIGGMDFIIEPKDGFKKLFESLKKKKKG